VRRRDFITLVSVTAAGWPLVARAERPPFLVGTIGSAPHWRHFREAMRDLGYREGQMLSMNFEPAKPSPPD
jgi:putative ABC transport system substrate-binding protein